jgi:hypothetical protein
VARRFQADRGDRTSRQPSDQLIPTRRAVGDTKSAPAGSDSYVQTIDRNIDPDIVKFDHLRTPSLLMRVRALATVRVGRIWRERQADPRPNSRDAHGLPAMTGAGRTQALVTLEKGPCLWRQPTLVYEGLWRPIDMRCNGILLSLAHDREPQAVSRISDSSAIELAGRRERPGLLPIRLAARRRGIVRL